jgi:hypothetical protein
MPDMKRFGERPPESLAPIPFEILAWPVDGGEPIVHEFEAVAMVAGGDIFDLAAQADREGRVPGAAIQDFFRSCLPEEQWERWQDVIHDREYLVSGEVLGEIVAWLNEQYNPPTRRSRRERRDSRGTRSQSGGTWRDEQPATA